MTSLGYSTIHPQVCRNILVSLGKLHTDKNICVWCNTARRVHIVVYMYLHTATGSQPSISASPTVRNHPTAEDTPPVEEPQDELSMYSINIVENCP